MELSYAQKQEIYEKGFVKIPEVVPGIMIDSALQSINHSMGKGMDKEGMAIRRAQSYCREIQSDPAITDLLHHTKAWELAEGLLGKGNIQSVHSGQIALRFPIIEDPPFQPSYHIDGMYSPNNGVPKGTIQNFTLLVGIFLSDVPHADMGNFTVWPKTHHIYESYFRKHGAESLLDGMPKVGMPDPQQITAKPGDVVLCHYQLAHGIAPNVSPHVRYAIFYRLSHVDLNRERWQEPMENIWLHWPGITAIKEETI